MASMNINRGEAVGLPNRPFLYTLDQIAILLELRLDTLRKGYIYFDGRSIGNGVDKMMARNIAPEGEPPEWRVAETELVRWLKKKRFRFYERGWLKS